jgi:hypothetical protein
LAVDWVLVLENRFVEALALFLGVPPTEQFRVSQSSPPKKDIYRVKRGFALCSTMACGVAVICKLMHDKGLLLRYFRVDFLMLVLGVT